MGGRNYVLAAMALLAGLVFAAPPPGAPSPGGGGARPPGGPPPGYHPPVRPVYGYGPAVSFYYGGPYWWGGWGGWGWPGAYWPYAGYYGTAHWPYYVGAYGYLPPTVVYGPPAVVTSTSGIAYIEREPGTVSTQQRAPSPPTPAPPPPDAEPPSSAPPGTPPATGQWWYFCASPRGAYPYVRECPGGWERVPAVPHGPTR